MNGKPCAPPDVKSKWNSIDWNRAKMYVRKLQARIVKAWKSGCIGKAKALMWLLTHSFYAKALAVKRVTENKGKNTPGVDRELWSTQNSKYNAIGRLTRRGYQPQPLRRIYIRKSNGKMRPISIPCMIDRAMQALYKTALEPVAETQADKNSYGFRPYRATQDAISQLFTAIARKNRAGWVLEGDIKGAFDNVSHGWMMENIPIDREILKKILKSGYVDCGKLFPTEEGTAQGGVISPTIFNCVLDGLEAETYKLIPQLRKKIGRNPNINIVRYADDFIVTGANREMLEQDVKPVIEKFLSVRGLQLSQDKTVVTQVKDGFDFLGWNVRKFKGKLIIRPAKKRVKGFLEKIRGIIKDNKAAKQEDLIHKLNPIIRGWANYHKNVCASKTFGYVDYQIWNCLWRWAKRRHPNKPQKWVMKRYFHSIGNKSCAFAKSVNKTAECDGVKYLKLVQASDTKIVRHVKVKGDLNPFDEDWEEYLEKRRRNHQAAQ